jgi:hypothetical protein
MQTEYIMDKNKLTSVKVNEELFEEFKVLCVRTKFSLQKLVDRSIHLYLTDDDFRKKLHNHTTLSLSGSQA